jgi:hypothetical protein
MQSDGNHAASVIRLLDTTLRAQGFGNVSIACCDAIGWSGQATITAQMISAGVEGLLGVVTSHAYTSQPTSPMNTRVKKDLADGGLRSRLCLEYKLVQ